MLIKIYLVLKQFQKLKLWRVAMEINKFPWKDIETLDSLEQRVNKNKENGKEHQNIKGKEKEESMKIIQET